MKIAFLVPEILNCGPLNVVLNIVKFLDRGHFEPILIAIRKTNDIEYQNIFNMHLNEIYYLDECKSKIQSLEGIVLDHGVQVIHSHGYYPDKLVNALNVAHIKKISTIHCMFYKDYLKEYGYWKGLIGAYLHSKLLKNGDFQYIVGCSSSVANYCKNNLKISKTLVINNGVDQNKYFILPESEKLKYKSELGLINKRIFIFAGRFIRRKRVPELLHLFNFRNAEDVVLLLLGDGPEKEECERVFSSDNIRFLGQVSNPEKYYQIADFVISNSEAEGYPMSVIEAASCGCYALLSNIPPHKEFLDKNPECASLIDKIDFNSFSVPKLNSKSIVNLSAKFMADKYMEIYSD